VRARACVRTSARRRFFVADKRAPSLYLNYYHLRGSSWSCRVVNSPPNIELRATHRANASASTRRVREEEEEEKRKGGPGPYYRHVSPQPLCPPPPLSLPPSPSLSLPLPLSLSLSRYLILFFYELFLRPLLPHVRDTRMYAPNAQSSRPGTYPFRDSIQGGCDPE